MPLGQLEGFTIGVTADRRWEQQSELLSRRGARVIHAPTIRTDYLTAEATVRDATMQVLRRPPDVFVATTGIGVRAWLETAQTWGLGADLVGALSGCRLVARGPKAAAALEANGLSGAERVASESMNEVLDLLLRTDQRGRVIVVQDYGHPSGSELTGPLEAAGAQVVSVPVYRWRVPADREPAYRLLDAMVAGEVDAVTFTSAPAVRNLLALAEATDRGDEARDAFNRRHVVAACVGPVCAQSAREQGIESPVAPDVGRLGLLVRSLSEELARRRTVLDGGGEPVTIQGAAVERAGHVIVLSARERAVLRRLVEAEGGTVGKTVLLRGVWRAPADRGAHVVEVTVGRLRRRLAPLGVSVVTVVRRGYRLETGPLPPERSPQE
ncbi:MAG TPA: uroporphyrinogen-III synthase [Acidimicrobiales bacterium]|nr:uroporphyrinogen-III synthase [Acidimicrobiales bacterium]